MYSYSDIHLHEDVKYVTMNIHQQKKNRCRNVLKRFRS